MRQREAFEALTPVAAEQGGYVTSQQATAVGVPPWVLLEFADRDLLRRVRRGVYMVEPGRTPSPHEDILSAWLAVDGKSLPWKRLDAKAIISHASAAALQGIGSIVPGVPEITVTRRVERPDMVTHIIQFTRDDWKWIRLDGSIRVPTTTPARTIVDLWIAHEEVDYLERAIRESFFDVRTATRELAVTAHGRRKRSEKLRSDLAHLAESAWPV